MTVEELIKILSKYDARVKILFYDPYSDRLLDYKELEFERDFHDSDDYEPYDHIIINLE